MVPQARLTKTFFVEIYSDGNGIRAFFVYSTETGMTNGNARRGKTNASFNCTAFKRRVSRAHTGACKYDNERGKARSTAFISAIFVEYVSTYTCVGTSYLISELRN